MRISRLYVSTDLNVGQMLDLQEKNAHYVRTVLRLKKNQAIILFNGLGDEYLCQIEEVGRKIVVILVTEKIVRSVESSLYLSLGLGVSRGDRMDWAVQKAVELGVNEITPLLTERCIFKLKNDKKQQKIQHWKGIVQHAAEQSGRTVLPVLNDIQILDSWVEEQKGMKVFLDPHAELSLSKIKLSDDKVTLLSGPEGGFSDQERNISIRAGFVPVLLGQRVLRAETATLAALSAAQMLWGDFV